MYGICDINCNRGVTAKFQYFLKIYHYLNERKKMNVLISFETLREFSFIQYFEIVVGNFIRLLHTLRCLRFENSVLVKVIL